MIKHLLSLLLSLICVLFPSFAARETPAAPVMQLHQVDVGCANCHLLFCGDTVILVDGGTNRYKPSTAPAHQAETGSSPEKMLQYVAATGIDHIDAHFVTHWHNDHAQQMPDFSAAYGTENTVVYGPSERMPDFFPPLPNGAYRQLTDGDVLEVGPFHIQCIGPCTVRRDGHINEDSLNLLITFGSFRMIFTGDYMHDEVWEKYGELVQHPDVFVFPHHGLEPYAVTSGALQFMQPEIVLVPGDAEGSLRSYFLSRRIYSAVYGNIRGNIVITSDGTNCQIHENVAPGEFTVDGK